MKRLLGVFFSMVMALTVSAANFTPGTEYYTALNIYDKYLGYNEAQDGPALSTFGTNTNPDSYVFVAEDCGTSGYVYLKQKSSGKYLAASTSNSWSVTLQNSVSNSDAFKWMASGGLDGYIRNKKNTGARLGIDGGKKGSDYVSVYYDKHQGSHASFRIIPATSKNITEAEQAYVSEVFKNQWGINEIDYIQLNGQTIDRSDRVDIHIAHTEKPILNGKVNLGSKDTWLIFDNIAPSDVISSYLKFVTIEGAAATKGKNCRVAIYLNGAAVIPIPQSPFTAYTEKGQGGESFNLSVDSHTNLGKNGNTMRSFILKRGYMATIASGTSGSGYSRVWVADHSDLQVDLPQALDMRVSSVYVKEWQYVSKKGWCSTNGNSKIATEMEKIRGTWFYTWSADRSSTDNYEYIPIRGHIYWPSMSQINGHKNATAVLSINEPEHSEQHESNDCSCGGVISAWKACTLNNDFLASGARIGSPAPTDASYLTEFIGHIDDMAYRCDFVAFHAYWGPNEANGTGSWYNQLKAIYDKTKRPIWITEWNYGASWTSAITSDHYETERKNIQAITELLDTCSFVERYAIYNWDSDWYRWMISKDDGWVTPAGQVYRDNRSTFAYKASMQPVPKWWKPSVKTPSMVVTGSFTTNLFNFEITNGNTDYTETMVIQSSVDGKNWTDIYTVTDRQLFENSTVKISGVSLSGVMPTDQFRVVLTTTLGDNVVSGNVTCGGLLSNPQINAESKSNVPGWTCTRDAQNGYTKADSGDTYLEVWNPTAEEMKFDYYQELSGLESGVYRLTANVFNSTNGVQGATVNGAVGLYAQTTNQLYFTPVTTDSELDTEVETMVDKIIVTDGKLKVGVRNIGVMSARWAGADNFNLVYLGKVNEALEDETAQQVRKRYDAVIADMLADNGDGTLDATRFLFNPDAANGTSFGWTVSNVGFNSGEGYDGNKDNKYFDKWSASEYTSSLEQTVTDLPAGEYTLSAILRSNSTHTLTLTATSSSGQTAASTFTGTGTEVAEGSDYPMGWQLVKLVPVKVKKGETLTVSLTTKGTSWWSADHFALTVDNPETVDIQVPQVNDRPSMADDRVYDLSGRLVNPAHLRPGIYIIGGKKVVVR